MNKRNTLSALLTIGLTPLATFAESIGQIHSVGILSLRVPPNQVQWTSRMQELGWTEGKNLRYELLTADGRIERLEELAGELVKRKVDVIYAFGPDAAVAAARATKTIPIVFYGVAFPIEQGLIASFARPGGNVTGVVWNSGWVKQIELVRKLVPKIKRLAHFLMPTALQRVDGAAFSGMIPLIEEIGKQRSIEFRSFKIDKIEDFPAAFKAINAWRAEGLFIYATPITVAARNSLIEFATSNKMLICSDWRGFTEAGGLVSYGPLLSELANNAAGLVDRILRGAHPAELPVFMPARYEFVLNRKTANALNIKLDQEMLLRADQIIS